MRNRIHSGHHLAIRKDSISRRDGVITAMFREDKQCGIVDIRLPYFVVITRDSQ